MQSIRVNTYIFFDKKVVGSRRSLQKKFGLKGRSYAGNIMRRIYHYYFENAINVKREYKKFYKKEFPQYIDYLVCHFNISNQLADKISKSKLYYSDLEWKSDHINYSFSYDEKLSDLFWNSVGGYCNEN